MLYVHIPFCKTKCLYCDFYTGGARIADWHRFVDSLLREYETRRNELEEDPSTLYLGGGTPSLIPASEFKRLIEGIRRYGHLNCYREATIEVNPEDVNDEKCKLWYDHGINRVSLGIQSFEDHVLKAIGRGHDKKQSVYALETLKKYFSNISVDLMFGLPGQTYESYQHTLATVLSFEPQHISSYSLMLEEGTAMTVLINREVLRLPEEDIWMKMLENTPKILNEAGYRHYEISNYALEGYESIHNSGYWSGQSYLGIGPGAHSYNGNSRRRFNPNDIKGYIKFFSGLERNRNVFYEEEKLSENEMREEVIMTRLRTCQGIDLKEFEKKFGKDEVARLFHKVLKFKKQNFMIIKEDRLKFTEKGWPLFNSIVADLF